MNKALLLMSTYLMTVYTTESKSLEPALMIMDH